MKVTVAICTHNRAKDTTEAVLSVLDQQFDTKEYEVLVVDNRSSDGTAAAIRRAAAASGSGRGASPLCAGGNARSVGIP